MMKLPAARHDGPQPLEAVLLARRSIREYAARPLLLEDIAQLLWAGQGLCSHDGRRTAPSAGALYPLEMYLVVGLISDFSPGVYRYAPQQHALIIVKEADQREALALAALGQQCVGTAPVSIVVAAVYQRTARKYGGRARRYVHMEVGHAGENILLQAASLGLGAVMVGAFDDQEVQRVLGLPADQEPLAIIPVGYPWGGAQQ